MSLGTTIASVPRTRNVSRPRAALRARSVGWALALGVAGWASVARPAEIVVDPGQLLPTPALGGWWFAEEVPTASGSMTTGPGSPPGRTGSATMSLDATGRMLLGTADYNATDLADLTSLEYSTHRSSVDAGGNLAISLQLQVDYDGTDGSTAFQGRLVFEPYFTFPGGVGQNVWQTWDPVDPGAMWWMSGSAVVGGSSVGNPCPQSSPCSWSTILSTFPDAEIHSTLGAILLKAGGPAPGFVGSADRFTLGISGSDTTFDFEPCADRYVDGATGSDGTNTCHDSGAPCDTIQHAIDVACDGDTIHVAPGTYAESPNVDKSVTILGTGGRDATEITLQTGPAYLGALQIDAAMVTVDGFTITGRDAACPTLAASNVLLTTNADDVELRNNRFRVGQIGGCTTGDDGFGVLTTYDTTVPALVTSLTVEDNLFVPLTASGGQRAFYVNPGVNSFTFRSNSISGLFSSTSITQAQTALVEDNVVDGQGLGGTGLGTWGYPDAAVWGQATFRGNVITGVTNAITLNESNDAVIECNRLQDNTRGVRVRDGFGAVNFDPTTIDIHTNSVIGNGTAGAENTAGTAGTVLAENNWWGCVGGPGNPGCDAVTGDVDYTPAATSVPTCVNCTADSQCQDGLGCTGAETCNLMTNVCADAPDVDCSGNPCFTGTCLEPSGLCEAEPPGTTCDSGLDVCSDPDECDGIDGSGICLNTGGGGDAEPDLVCELDDNCPGVSNPTQSDIDSDTLGDECDPNDSPGSWLLYRARLRTARLATTTDGSATVNAILNVNDTQAGFAATALAGDLQVSISDDDASFAVTRPLDNCVSAGNGKIRCVSGDGFTKAIFAPARVLGGPYLYRVKIILRGLTQAETGATQPGGPVGSTLNEGPAIDRVDSIGDLVPPGPGCSALGSRVLLCREES
jgi:hypothetical protein